MEEIVYNMIKLARYNNNLNVKKVLKLIKDMSTFNISFY
jgi:hypothetical protein